MSGCCKEQDDLRRALERSRERVGVDPEDLQRVAAAALSRAGLRSTALVASPSATSQPSTSIPPIPPSRRMPAGTMRSTICGFVPASAANGLGEWRRNAPIRSIAFRPPVLGDGRDATDVVQVHLEHRLVRRLLSRFLSQGFQSKLSRVSVIYGTGRAAARRADGPARGLWRRRASACMKR